MTPAPLHVAILWHMHQPDYRDPETGRSLMPWTWLHALKDYGEMLRTLAEIPGATATFNLVPTLVEQLLDYRGGHRPDDWLALLEAAPEQLPAERQRHMLDIFFNVHRERHIQPYARYRDLAERRPAGLDAFSPQDLRDLQVWFLLSWTGYLLRQREPLIPHLFKKEHSFTEKEKGELLHICQREVEAVLPLYQQLEQEGRIEISLTPYAHPILPLICDSDTAHQASTGEPLPTPPFQAPDDAALQVRLAQETVTEVLGARPRGMWPAEGAVSGAALALMRQAEVLWAATDEGILAKSLPGGLTDRRRLYQPYTLQGLPLVFRDRELSDRIGFLYADWEPGRAASDLLKRLEGIAELHPGGLLTLILDGENCWERYRDNGHPFLTALYQGLNDAPHLQPVTVSQGLAAVPALPLERIAPGSWINGDFGIWIGHAEENTGWALLRDARKALAPACHAAKNGDKPSPAQMALLRAEGSDWFWWFGEDHSTEQAHLFDALFRRHLQSAYHLAGKAPPDSLFQPIKELRRRPRVTLPMGRIAPALDGQPSSFFAWLGAGQIDLTGSGAMHAEQGGFSRLLFGSDGERLYLRLEAGRSANLGTLLQHRLEIHLADWTLAHEPAATEVTLSRSHPSRKEVAAPCVVGEALELTVPLAQLALKPGTDTSWSIRLLTADRELGRWPAEGPARCPWPDFTRITTWLV